MLKNLMTATVLATVAGAGLVATPAIAQDYYGRGDYRQSYNDDRGDRDDQDRYEQNASYQNDRQFQEYRRYDQQRRPYYNHRYRANAYQGYSAYEDDDSGRQQYYGYRGAYPQ